MAADIDDYWENLKKGRDCISEIPAERWDYRYYFDEDRKAPGKSYSKWGGFVDGADCFDPLFFNISPQEAERMDPQERLFLETVYHTMEDAGYTADKLDQEHLVGLFVGVMWGHYQLYGPYQPEAMPGSPFWSIANRISYTFNFQGPSLAVDTACSSSLTAIHLACESIKRHESNIAIAGGVNLSVHPDKYLLLSQNQFVSSDGRCRSFGKGGDGYVPGEGVGAILLKPLQQAVADGDRIYAVIKGSSLNHGGKTNGYTVPNPVAQAKVISKALENAAVPAESISYLEAHGTGTSLGDPIEIAGLSKAYGEEVARQRTSCSIGSAKSNIGHLESAAGIAGITKVLLQMRHQQLVPSLHSEQVNPHIDFARTPFYLQHKLEPWQTRAVGDEDSERRYPRRAGISSFGAGGANAHIILEEYPQADRLAEEPAGPQLIVLSAKNNERLQVYAAKLLQAVNTDNPPAIHEIAYTLQTGREALEQRLALIADDTSSLIEKLELFSQKISPIDDLYQGNVKQNKASALIEGEAGQAFMDIALRSHDLAKLARLWVTGIDIDWQLLYQRHTPGRIALPVYPFAAEHYWIKPSLPQARLRSRAAPPLQRKTTHRVVQQTAPAETPQQGIKQLLLNELSSQVSAILKISAEQIGIQDEMSEYGFDSVSLTDFISRVNERFALELTPAIFFKYATLDSFAEFLEQEHELARYFGDVNKQTEKASVQPPSRENRSPDPLMPHLEQHVSPWRATLPRELPGEAEWETVAIVGMDGLFPQSDDLDAFWRHLANGDDLVTEVPPERWDWRDYYDPTGKDRTKSNSKWAGFINDVDKFDPGFFKISPREAEMMDPQHRLLLQTVWKAIEDAGYRAGELSGEKIGVFMGVQFQEYQALIAQSVTESNPQIATGNSHAVLVNRISYLFNFTGPSVAIDTACSSSLVALHQAVRSIQLGESTAAVVGGVSLALMPETFTGTGQMGVLSPDGKCKTFDKSANGYVKGEGVGALLLKPLSQAIADRDTVYAVIAGTAINHGGKANSLTAPNAKNQTQLLLQAYRESGFDPQTISYIENHGTGTKLGDPVEIEGLKDAFKVLNKEYHPDTPAKTHYCGLGSVKTNIGHLEPAAGIAGIIKVLLSIKHKALPASIHFKEQNPYIELENTPFYIVDKTRHWDVLQDELENPIPRRAGVSSFGFGGTYAHVVLEEFIPDDDQLAAESAAPGVFVLSAKNRERLIDYAGKIQVFLKPLFQNGISFADLLYTLQTGREPMAERLAFVANNLPDVNARLQHFLDGDSDDSIYQGNSKQQKEQQLLLLDGNAGKAYVNAAIQSRELEKLLRLWVNGVAIDWRLLYPQEMPRRISVPAYPFAKESYWIPQAAKRQKIPPSETDELQITAPVQTLYFAPQWKDHALSQEDHAIAQSMVLVLAHAALAEHLQPHVKQVISVTNGHRFERNDKHYVIDFHDKSQFGQLLAALQQDQLRPDKIIYYCQPGLNEGGSLESIDQGVYLDPLLYLVQSWMEQDGDQVPVQIITLGTFAAPSIDQCLAAAVSSFGITLNLENDLITYRHINVQDGEMDSLPALLRKELAVVTGSQRVRYHQHKRKILSYQPFALSDALAKENLLRKNGVYLITGGMGGLGFLFAEFLARAYKAKLILAGRSALSDEKRQRLQGLQALGAQAVYLAADISQLDAVRQLISEAKKQFGSIHGIIHAAGSIYPDFVQNKTQDIVSQIIRPKVLGTLFLDEATRQEPLDFLFLFSSIAGAIGDIGLSDYAYGNAFLDHFAAYRESLCLDNKRFGRTLAINWPAWKEGGMQMNAQTWQLLYETWGMVPLTAEAGLKAFQAGLLTAEEHFIVAQGDAEKLKKRIHAYESGVEQKPDVAESPSIDPKQLKQRIQQELIDQTAEMLKISPRQIDVMEEMTEFGFESITLTEFANLLNSLYHLELTPAIFFKHSTLDSLASFLAEKYANQTWQVSKTGQKDLPGFEEDLPGFFPAISKQAVAVIGMDGIFPQSPDLQTFWQHLVNEKDLISEIPLSRWDWRRYYGDSRIDHNKANSKWGGFIPNMDRFDAKFFKISRTEAEMMDPQHRLLLETVWRTIEDAGYKVSDLSGKAVGTFVGVQFQDYQNLLNKFLTESNAQVATGNSHAVLVNRIAYLLNFRGPSQAIDTACSSSLVALHQAVRSIQLGESEMAVAGGVSLMLSPETFLGTSQLGVLSADGKCKTFDQSADGYVKGEGIATVLLKPLSQAIADDDHIYGVIAGTAINHGGKANSLTTPNPKAQARLLLKAYQEAGFDANSISYIETHGTGTKLGDPVEIEGLKDAFELLAKDSPEKTAEHYCGLGSVKTNIGHLEPAAGIAGLIKVLLAMEHRTIPASIHFKQQNPYIDLKNSPFYIVNQTKAWPALKDSQGKPVARRAGISSFGFGGANAHAVLEEYPKAPPTPAVSGSQVFVLSAKNIESLRNYAAKMADFLIEAPVEALVGVCNPDRNVSGDTAPVGVCNPDRNVSGDTAPV
ncbi:MAG: SDR family NAD(P)-dependent oxidoreductase, partial [Gammaproteobacteria bacterium]|nr:SDR family NAD(P)-dependent oxidoreductase [Gammaproteobacteria bacterium]